VRDCGDNPTSIDAVASTVQRQRPDLRQHAAPDGTVTLMFSGIADCTRMTEHLGDRAARALIQAHNAIIRKQIAVHGGFEVALEGDGFLLAFANAHQAIWCAIAIQRALAAYNAAHPQRAIRVRIGLHTGEALTAADRFFGTTVILTARIAALARGSEILVSSALKQLIDDAADPGQLPGQCVRFGGAREVELSGMVGRYALYPVVWGPQE
jgi:class 3 adenylate cyclase